MRPSFLAICLLLSLSGGCRLEKLFPGKVADGAARLTLINMAGLLAGLAADKKCGFKDPKIRYSKNLDKKQPSKIYQTGMVSWETRPNCELNFPEPTILSSDCLDDGVVVQGKVTIEWAKQSRWGVMTDADYQPVIPQGDAPVKIQIKNAKFSNFKSWFSSNPEQYMAIKEGTLSEADVDVHLAKDAATELCSLQVPNVTVNNYQFDKPVKVNIPGLTGRFDLTLDFLDIQDSQVGIFYKADGSTVENELFAIVDLWGNRVQVPTDDQGLDPNFTPDFFLKSVICEKLGMDPAISPPLQFDCRMDEFIAKNTMRLTTKNMSEILGQLTIPGDPNGFFSVQNMLYHGILNGSYGEEGTMTLSLDPMTSIGQVEPLKTSTRNPCIVENNLLPSYLLGTTLIESGNFKVTGELYNAFLGANWFTTIPYVIQKKPWNTRVFVRASKFNENKEGFSAYDLKDGENSPSIHLTFHSGAISALVSPLFTINNSQDCYFEKVTPIANLEIETHEPVEVELNLRIPDATVPPNKQHVKRFKYRVDFTDFDAMNGFYMGEGNYVRSGRVNPAHDDLVPIKINGQDFSLPPFKLNPGYNFKEFNQAYVCKDASVRKPVPENGPIAPNCGG